MDSWFDKIVEKSFKQSTYGKGIAYSEPLAGSLIAIAHAIVILAEAVKYHADVTAPLLPEKDTQNAK